MSSKKSEYNDLIRDAINHRLIESFVFGRIRFEWVYTQPYITIVDRITQLYLGACEDESPYYDPFYILMGWMRYEYGSLYIKNLIYGIGKYYEFKYNTCIKCPDCGTYCDMDRKEIRDCMQRAEQKFYDDAYAASWTD